MSKFMVSLLMFGGDDDDAEDATARAGDDGDA